MSDHESDSDLELNNVSESLQKIHQHMESLFHDSKHLYSRALRIQQLTDNPALDLWAEQYKLHDRAHGWAKKHLVPRKCSLWQVHQTLLDAAKKDNRIFVGQHVRLSKDEAEIMDLPENHHISVWQVLGRLPRFFL